MPTFTKEIVFSEKVFNTTLNKYEDKNINKTATFNELDPRDDKQHEYHFAIMGAFTRREKNETTGLSYFLDSDVLSLTKNFIKKFLVITPEFTEQDKMQLLLDAGALFIFGMGLLNEKVFPFFQILADKSVQ